MMAGLFSLFTIQGILFHEVAYPLYLFLFDLTVLLIVIKVIKKKKFK
jgi:hypothetical protein